jgi:CheY-like chemotaxis protein
MDAERPPPLPKRCALRVLIVDDHKDTAESFFRVLKMWGFKAEVCLTPTEALVAYLNHCPQAVLLDLGLPEMDGCQLARIFSRRSNGEGKPLLIAVTAHGLDTDRQRCQEAGFDHFWLKGSDPEELHKLLRREACRRGSIAP